MKGFMRLALLALLALCPAANAIDQSVNVFSSDNPAHNVNASMQTTKPVYEGNDHVTLVVTNEGPAALSFGTMYSLETLNDGTWSELRSKGMRTFIAIGYSMGKGGTWEQDIPLEDVADGHYRFVKEVQGEGTEIKRQLYAEFDVKNK